MTIKYYSPRERGVALLMVAIAAIGLLSMTVVVASLARNRASAGRSYVAQFQAHALAETALAQGLARIKYGGMLAPSSNGNGSWVSVSDGEFAYKTSYDSANATSVISAYGRVLVGADSSDSTDWLQRGVELTVSHTSYIPDSPVYFGNGGVEKPAGGFSWSGGVDPTDPSTWVPVSAGSASSKQASWVALTVNAVSHPYDYLYGGIAPPIPLSGSYPYSIWNAQTTIGQYNLEAWFKNSAGAGDPITKVFPTPSTPFYSTDPDSESYAYPVKSSVPDVQSFAWQLWSNYSGVSGVNKLSGGSHDGTYGDLSTPEVTFVTGNLQVDSGKTLKGVGVLVIRDDYDPNVDSDNTPSTYASVDIRGTLEWTGLVIVAGWKPEIRVATGGDATIVGSLFGEDSVQSGGEVSLDSASIVLQLDGALAILYSRDLFEPGGIINKYLPDVVHEIVGVREL